MSSVFLRVSRGRGTVALADQVLVSGTNFLTSIVLVRGLGLHEFGKYAIAYALLLYVNDLQRDFLIIPMLSIAPLMEDEEKSRFVDGMLALQLIASGLVFVIFALVGVIAHAFTDFYTLRCVFAFACCVGTYQLQDWLRRFYFLSGRGKLAIVNDGISYLGQLLVLSALWRLHCLTLSVTFVAMAVTSIAALLMGPLTTSLRPAIGRVRETWGKCRKLSRDLLIATQIRWLGSQGILIFGTGIVGATAVGGLRATQSLTGPVNIFLSSLENVLPIRIGDELKYRGTAGAYAFIQKGIVVGTVFFGALIIPIAIFGRAILRVIYGPAVIAYYIPMLLQLVNIVVGANSRLWFFFFRGVQDTRPLLRANILCALANLGSIYWFGTVWGASGIVLSGLLGQALVVGYSMLYWRRHRYELLLRYPPNNTATSKWQPGLVDI